MFHVFFMKDVRILLMFFFCLIQFLLVGSVVSPRSDSKRTVRVQTSPGYRLLVDQIPNQDQTMVSQRFNKISPFVTEHGNNPNANPVLRQSLA